MPLTNFKVNKNPEVDDAIVVKADDGKERVVTQIPRKALEDRFPQHSRTAGQRVALVETNVDAIANIMRRKYDRGEWQAIPRFGSTIRQISDVTEADLRRAP
jgi:hypothetical protein